MVKPNENFAFTLIELLAVIVILGVLLGIGAGIYMSYVEDSSDRSYNIAENSFMNATMAAMEHCMAGGSTTGFCAGHNVPQNQYDFELVYLRELIAGDYIDPIKNPDDTDKFCDEDKSYVYVSNRADMDTDLNYDLYYKVCLVCGDRRSEFCDEEVEVPADFETYCDIYYDEGLTTPYDGAWTDQDLFLRFSVSEEGYRLGISRFLYKSNSGTKWDKLDVREPFGTARWTDDVNEEVLAKGYDDLNQVGSTAVCGGDGMTVRVDKTIIKSVTITGKRSDGKALPSDTWSYSDVTLTANPTPETTISGYLYRWYKDGEVVQDWNSSSSYVATTNGTYKVEVTNALMKQIISSNEYVVKIDRVVPQMVVKNNPINLGIQDYNFKDNVSVTYGDAGGEFVCNPATSRKTGSYTVTCTATGNNDRNSTISFTVYHQYASTTCATGNTYTQSCNPHSCCVRTEKYCVWVPACAECHCHGASCGDSCGDRCCCGVDGSYNDCNRTRCAEYGTCYDTCTYTRPNSYCCPNGGTYNVSTRLCVY